MNTTWESVIDAVAEELRRLPSNHFIIVAFSYDAARAIDPYAQGAMGPAGVSCEAVSERYLPDSECPLDRDALRAAGWCPPNGLAANWTMPRSLPPQEAAVALVSSLRDARGCTEPGAIRWSTGAFPPPPA